MCAGPEQHGRGEAQKGRNRLAIGLQAVRSQPKFAQFARKLTLLHRAGVQLSQPVVPKTNDNRCHIFGTFMARIQGNTMSVRLRTKIVFFYLISVNMALEYI